VEESGESLDCLKQEGELDSENKNSTDSSCSQKQNMAAPGSTITNFQSIRFRQQHQPEETTTIRIWEATDPTDIGKHGVWPQVQRCLDGTATEELAKNATAWPISMIIAEYLYVIERHAITGQPRLVLDLRKSLDWGWTAMPPNLIEMAVERASDWIIIEKYEIVESANIEVNGRGLGLEDVVHYLYRGRYPGKFAENVEREMLEEMDHGGALEHETEGYRSEIGGRKTLWNIRQGIWPKPPRAGRVVNELLNRKGMGFILCRGQQLKHSIIQRMSRELIALWNVKDEVIFDIEHNDDFKTLQDDDELIDIEQTTEEMQEEMQLEDD